MKLLYAEPNALDKAEKVLVKALIEEEVQSSDCDRSK